MELQLSNQKQRVGHLSKPIQRTWLSLRSLWMINSVEIQSPLTANEELSPDDTGFNHDTEEDYDPPPARKRSKKSKIYCFNCNRQEFHIMAFKGTALHSFLVGMTFGLARVFGPYRCTCCGRKRAMYADFCSLSYHWRMMSERRLSGSSRRRRRG